MHAKTERNLTPATATSYFLTVLIPQYREKMNLRTSRELRTLCKALDLLASGNPESAGDILSHSNCIPVQPGMEPCATPGADSSRGSELSGERRDTDGHEGAGHRAEDATADSRAAVETPGQGEERLPREGERKRKRRRKEREIKDGERGRHAHGVMTSSANTDVEDDTQFASSFLAGAQHEPP